MAPPRPIPTGSPSSRRESIAGLASSFAASLADPSPLAQAALARDIADLTPSDIEAESAAASYHSAGILTDTDGLGDADSDYDITGAHTPYLYRRPSAIAYGTTRPALGVAPNHGPALTKEELARSREAEASLLRDNHLLPPKHIVAAVAAGAPGSDIAVAPRQLGFFGTLYKRMFSPRRPLDPAEEERRLQANGISSASSATVIGDGEPDEQTALLASAPAPDAAPAGNLDDQWEAAVAAGQIHTTWQRELKTIATYSRSLIITFLLQYSINITGVFAVGHIGKAELGAVSRMFSLSLALSTFFPLIPG